jgi:hypothetical protein
VKLSLFAGWRHSYLERESELQHATVSAAARKWSGLGVRCDGTSVCVNAIQLHTPANLFRNEEAALANSAIGALQLTLQSVL